MLQEDIISENLRKNEFKVFKNLGTTITIYVPLPTRKINCKLHSYCYGNFEINFNGEIENCEIKVSSNNHVPYKKDLLKAQSKMIGAMCKAIDIIHNSKITKKIALDFLKEKQIDDYYYKLSIDRLNGINKNGQTDLFDTDFEQLTLLEGDKNE